MSASKRAEWRLGYSRLGYLITGLIFELTRQG
jgi:hypothetical protein